MTVKDYLCIYTSNILYVLYVLNYSNIYQFFTKNLRKKIGSIFVLQKSRKSIVYKFKLLIDIFNLFFLLLF